jgi:hypothetical protein
MCDVSSTLAHLPDAAARDAARGQTRVTELQLPLLGRSFRGQTRMTNVRLAFPLLSRTAGDATDTARRQTKVTEV